MKNYRVIPIGTTCELSDTEQPARPDNPWTTISLIDDFARTRVGSLALVLGNRVCDIDPKEARSWQGHDTLCMHDQYGLCWLPSGSLREVS